MATAQSTNDLTRQQLDELDALLQKMLALPLNPPEGTGPPMPTPNPSRAMVSELPLPEMPPLPSRAVPAPSYTTPITAPFPISNGPAVRRADPSSGPVLTPQLLVIPTKIDAVPVASRKAASNQLRPAEPNVLTTPAAPKIEIPAKPVSTPALPNIIPDAVQAPISPGQPKTAKVESIPAALAPLVAFNRAVNYALGRLGLPGRVLRSGSAKNLLALSGLALLAYTAAKIAQSQGWAAFSMVLPWPS